MLRLTSVLVTLVAMVLAITALVQTRVAQELGWGLFVGAPFVAGALATVLRARGRELTGRDMLAVTTQVILVAGAAVVLFAIDGLICVLMALPIALPAAWLGGACAWMLVDRCRDFEHRTRASSVALLPLLWLGMAAEPALLPEPSLRPVSTSVVIEATPAQVWGGVIGFSTITAPPSWIFRLGIAAPQSAVLEGEGPGAVRRCVFSTGEFVEPITVWEPGRRLAFDVLQQPPPMTETSIWPALEPPHLHDVFVSERGEFRIEPLGDGRVRLTGTTWYRQRLWPQLYWNALADQLIHAIHTRVLEHIEMTVEGEA